jgi:hypothetical protein
MPVILNEVAWMGSATSSNDEWIELKNVSASTISLNNWQLIGTNTQNNNDNIEIFFGSADSIPENSYFLLERTDDNSVPGISADKIFTGSINDSEFVLRLFDDKCQLIDEVSATSTWPAGQKIPERKTMERGEDWGWHTSFATSSINGLFGTPKTENSKSSGDIEGQNSTSSEATSTYGVQEEESVPSLSVVINEIAWMGSATSSWDEWIELYNNNRFFN